MYSPVKSDYSKYGFMAMIHINTLVKLVASYQLENFTCENEDEYKAALANRCVDIRVIIMSNIEAGIFKATYTEVLGTDPVELIPIMEEVPDKINLDEFLEWAIRKNLTIPKCWVKSDKAGADIAQEPVQSGSGLSDAEKTELQASRKKLKELENEKLKWDASIRAATNIGLLYYEGGLPKQAKKDEFIKMYREMLEDLPDSTIDMLYGALPTEYRNLGGRPKKAADSMTCNIDAVIKAAVYAGSIYDTDDVKSLAKLKKELQDNEYVLPPDEILKQIIEVTKNI